MCGSFKCTRTLEDNPHGHQYVQNRKCSQAGNGQGALSAERQFHPPQVSQQTPGALNSRYTMARPAAALPPPSTAARTPDAPKTARAKKLWGKVRSGPDRSYDLRGYRRKVVQPPRQRPSSTLSYRSLAQRWDFDPERAEWSAISLNPVLQTHMASRGLDPHGPFLFSL